MGRLIFKERGRPYSQHLPPPRRTAVNLEVQVSLILNNPMSMLAPVQQAGAVATRKPRDARNLGSRILSSRLRQQNLSSSDLIRIRKLVSLEPSRPLRVSLTPLINPLTNYHIPQARARRFQSPCDLFTPPTAVWSRNDRPLDRHP